MKEHASLKEGAHKNEVYSFRSTALFISLGHCTKYKYRIGRYSWIYPKLVQYFNNINSDV